jgi:hypothetical protein
MIMDTRKITMEVAIKIIKPITIIITITTTTTTTITTIRKVNLMEDRTKNNRTIIKIMHQAKNKSHKIFLK